MNLNFRKLQRSVVTYLVQQVNTFFSRFLLLFLFKFTGKRIESSYPFGERNWLFAKRRFGEEHI